MKIINTENYYYFAYYLHKKVLSTQKICFEESLHEAHIFQSQNAIIYYRYEKYDSEFYGFPIFKILYANENLTKSLFQDFLRVIFHTHSNAYIWADLPSEDNFLLQKLTASGMKIIETRLHFFTKNFTRYQKKRFDVKNADVLDLPLLKKIAAENPNLYDRHHSEPFFCEKADLYLAMYVENALKGFCDSVLMPAQLPNFAFMALNIRPEKSLDALIAKPIVSAVAPQNKGWHFKLLYACMQAGACAKADIALMNTQTTNKAVIKNFEKLKLSYGATSHILGLKAEEFLLH